MKSRKTLVITTLACSVLLSACGSGLLPGPTSTSTSTRTSTPSHTVTPTSSKTPTMTPTFTPSATPTPISGCSPRAWVPGDADNDFPAYLDILGVSTALDGTHLTVAFQLRDIPDEIIINRNGLDDGYAEIAWAVVIDTDDNPDTGGFVRLRGGLVPGYEYELQAFNFKQGEEQSGPIESLFRDKTLIWQVSGLGSQSLADGSLQVDRDGKRIVISGDIPDITPGSFLTFYTYYDGEEKGYIDQLCLR